MENEFKVPSFEPKSKVVAKKSKSSADDVDNSKELVESTPVAVAKEPETDIKTKLPKCPYAEPKWSQAPESSLIYSFEVLKGGTIVEKVDNLQNKAFWTIGKFQTNDIVMAHPTVSRYHAVLQYRPEVTNNGDSSDSSDDDDAPSNVDKNEKPKVEKGWYLYDLNSTHGTLVNKMKVPPKTYVRIRVGYMLKFGASTRNYILQGPGFDEEAESELTITEMKELRLKKQQEQQEKIREEERKQEEQGISWGMTEDADEETDLSHNPFATTNNEDLFLDDPKKTLRGYFEREGLNLDYKVDEVSNGTYVCRIELPITDSIGRSITAEFTHKGKKKECVVQCALEACRILDRHGLLRQANHEPRKRKVQSDDDDDDEFYDRTTEAEEKRRRKAGTEESVTLSYEQLIEEEKKLQSQLLDTKNRIERYQQLEKATKEKEAMDVDDLDDFMTGLSNEKQMDKADVRKCKFEVQRIQGDIQKVQKLINIAKPFELPPLNAEQTPSNLSQTKKSLPLFGKKRTFGFDKLKLNMSNKHQPSPNETKSSKNESVEEFDEDEDGVEVKATNVKIDNLQETVPEKSTCVDDTTKKPDKQIDTSISQITPAAPQAAKHEDPPNDAPSSSKISENIHQSDGNTQLPITESHLPNTSNSNSSKKKKHKNRHSNKMRNQIDIDDTEEDVSPQKYSGWIPPENQSGDGMTELNSKYGY